MSDQRDVFEMLMDPVQDKSYLRAVSDELAALTFVVPMPPNLANSRMHWRVKHDKKLDYWSELDDRQFYALLPEPPMWPFDKASIRATMYLGAAMDDGNAMNRLKWVEDWLVTRGYIKDDRKTCLKWEGFPEQVIRRDGNYRVEITLTPVAA